MSLASWFRDNIGGVEEMPSDSVQIDLSPQKPRLAAVRHAPSSEDFDAWRDHFVTQFVFAAMREARAAQQQMWTEASWVSGTADPVALAEFRARADAYMALEEGTYEAFCEWAGVEPEKSGA